MKQIKNEHGNALITVLLITVIFTALGLSILSATLGGTKRTEIRKEDIDITYQAVEVIDDFTTELSRKLQEDSYEIIKLNKNINNFTNDLNTVMNDIVTNKNYESKEDIVKVKANVLSSEKIAEDKTLTRIVEVQVTTKAKNSSVNRTAVKRLIVSPLPSFLKYALGSEKGKLSLNGSPNIVGNVFANTLSVQKEANYFTKTGKHTIDTNMPSIIGDLYAGEYEESKFNAKEMLDLLKPANFYHEQVPEWKNDSQYQEIYFNTSYEQERQKAFLNNAIQKSEDVSLLSSPDLSVVSGVPQLLHSQITKMGTSEEIIPEPFKLVDTNVPGELRLKGNLLITNTKKMEIDTLLINGDVTIVANKKMIIDNLYVSGDLEIINNPDSEIILRGEVAGQGQINFENAGEFTSQGNFSGQLPISIENNGQFETNGKISGQSSISIKNAGAFDMNNTAASKGDFTINNKPSGKMETKNSIASLSSLLITNNGELNILSENSEGKASNFLSYEEDSKDTVNNIFASNSIDILNTGTLFIKNNIYAEQASQASKLKIESTGKIQLDGDIFSGCDTCEQGSTSLIVRDSNMSFSGNLFSQVPLTVRGDQSDKEKEDDNLIADGVVYVQKETFISNLNIKGDSEKQLIFLSGENLTITRINEFSNFDPSKEEKEAKNYLPKQTDIEPLKAFFYTDKTAELYGVGSLFYINGGLFAKKDLIINGIRGNVSNQSDLLSKLEDEDGHYSRFIIDYNEDVLLQYIDTLPKVQHLSLYSGDLTVE